MATMAGMASPIMHTAGTVNLIVMDGTESLIMAMAGMASPITHTAGTVNLIVMDGTESPIMGMAGMASQTMDMEGDTEDMVIRSDCRFLRRWLPPPHH